MTGHRSRTQRRSSIGRIGGRAGIALAIWGLLCRLAHADPAGFRPQIAAQVITNGDKTLASVTINGHPAATLRTFEASLGPEARIALVVKRLQALVAAGLQAGEVTPHKASGKVWGVRARGGYLILALPAEAQAQGLSSETLARLWASAIARQLAQPPLLLSDSGLTIPFGETRTVTVTGAVAPLQITATDSDSQITQSVWASGRRTITIRGVATGRGNVVVSGEGASVSLPVVVMKYAARVSPAETITVTGTPSAPVDLVTQAIYGGLARAVDAQPGAQVRLITTPQVAGPLPLGGQVTVHIPMHIAGADLLPVEASAQVTVVNQDIVQRPATALFYSNNPEQVKQSQALFAGRLQPFKPVRLDYHHQNESGGLLVFHAELINGSDAPCSVQIISGLSLPGADTVQVGRRAGAAFLKAINGNQGLVLQIPPHARVPVVTQRFAAGLTVSGIVQMQQINGPANAVTLRIAADNDQSALLSPVGRVLLNALGSGGGAPPLPDMPTDYGQAVPLPPASATIFAAPQINAIAAYAVGGRWAHVRIGHTDSLLDETGKLKLFGNYGADYEVALTLTNPTAAPRIVGLFFAPEAGSAAGVFRVDGGPVLEFSPISPPAEPEIARYTLAPGETRAVKLQTIPLNGSSYPLSVIAHAL